MDLLDSLLSCANQIFENANDDLLLPSISMEDFLRKLSIDFPLSQPPTLGLEVNVNRKETIDNIIFMAVHDLVNVGLILDIESWCDFLKNLISACNDIDEKTRIAKLSLFITASRFPREYIHRIIYVSGGLRVSSIDPVVLNNDVLAFLKCDQVIDAMNTTITEFQGSVGDIPRIIMVDNDPSAWRGWIAFNGYIVVNSTFFDAFTDEALQFPNSSVLDQASLVLHLWSQLKQREIQGVFASHFPIVFPLATGECGQMTARAVWDSVWPQWFSPPNPIKAEHLATIIVNSVKESGSFHLTCRQHNELKRYVGDRALSADSSVVLSGVDYHCSKRYD